jgi:hypothetical protein
MPEPAKAPDASATSPSEQPSRQITIDWYYLLFYVGFFIALLLIASFGLIAEF